MNFEDELGVVYELFPVDVAVSGGFDGVGRKSGWRRSWWGCSVVVVSTEVKGDERFRVGLLSMSRSG